MHPCHAYRSNAEARAAPAPRATCGEACEPRRSSRTTTGKTIPACARGTTSRKPGSHRLGHRDHPARAWAARTPRRRPTTCSCNVKPAWSRSPGRRRSRPRCISVADIAAGQYAYTGVLTALLARAVPMRVRPWSSPCSRPSQSGWASRRTTPGTEGHHPRCATAPRAQRSAFTGPSAMRGAGWSSWASRNRRESAVFCDRVLGDGELATDPRFITNRLRVAHREELTADIGTRLQCLQRRRRPCAPRA